MSTFKCKMCGGTLEIQPGQTVVECEYCGTQQTLPRLDDDRRANLYDRANHFRRNNDFDKAMGIYEQILNEDQTDAESYWSLVLCRYGIEYVENPEDHKRIPTVHRVQYTSVFDDSDYKSALEYADTYQRSIYENEAKAINEIQKGILAISQQEEPFDVFICYKESDNNGRRTPDSVLANDLYHQLTQEGFKVFFARITLEDKLGSAYEPYIFAALNSAKVMIVLGTRPEYFSAVWVKNEWSRYLALIRQGEKKILIPAYKDMDPYDLPEEFSHLQAQDMSKLGFMQDLIRGIKKITQKDDEHTTIVKETVISNGNVDTAALLKRVFMFLEDGDWKAADEYCEKVLDIDPENASAYLGKLLSELEVRKQENLKICARPFDDNKNYQKAIRFADEKLKAMLIDCIDYINTRNEEASYWHAIDKMDSAGTEKEYKEAAALFETIEYLDAETLAQDCYEKAEIARKNAILSEGKEKMQGQLIADCEAAIELFQSISGWEDADERISDCHKKIEELKKKAEAERLEREQQEEIAREEAARIAKRKKKKKIIVRYSVCAILAIGPLLHWVIIPNIKYNNAIAQLEAGEYEKAIESFEELDDYRDSTTKITECQYRSAVELMENGDYFEARSAFENLNGYNDSEEKILECYYRLAMELMENGDYSEAQSAFGELKGYNDSAEKILECQYLCAIELMEEGDYESAFEKFEEAEGYSDSAEKIVECQYLLAIESMENGDYSEAKEAFENLNGYSDSAGMITECKKAMVEKLEVNDYVFFGKYTQYDDNSDRKLYNIKESIKWHVLDIQDGKAFVISEDALDHKPYNEEEEAVTWETCTLRAWLNDKFINEAFSEQEQAIISTVEVLDNDQEDKICMDKVFLLSYEENQKYMYGESVNVCKNESTIFYWSLRDIYPDDIYCNYCVLKEKKYGTGSITKSFYIRPAMWIDLNAYILNDDVSIEFDD